MYRLVVLILFSLSFNQYVNIETGWEFNQSSSQSFYIFENIEIDGNTAIGDGWAPSVTLDSNCLDTPYSCDVVGAFINDVCVGWVYADIDGGTTLPVMGVDNTNFDTQQLTQDYCIQGDIPQIKIFDSSYGTTLSLTSGDVLPGWQENNAEVIFNISFANNGIINLETDWSYYQTSQQAFYLFENILIGQESTTSNDVIGAFKNNICVGWSYVDVDGYTTVPVMGAELDGFYSDYMYDEEVPVFVLYDNSSQSYYNIVSAVSLESWSNNSTFIINGDSNVELSLDQSILLTSGWNMFSLNVDPLETNLYSIIAPLHGDLLLVLDETGSAIFPDASGLVWTDNIGDWESTEGYLIKIDTDFILDVPNSGNINLPLNIPLTSGWNIISYPAQTSNDIESVLSSLLSSQNLALVFNEGGNVYIPDYVTGSDPVNSINSLSVGEGYYVKVNNSATLVITEPAFEEDDMIVENTVNRDQHFTPVWSGNPFSPMTIIMDNALWDGVELEVNDEIGVFDGTSCVGAYVVPDGGFPANSNVEIVTSKNDGSGNGYTEGNSVSFRVWRDSQEVDIDVDINMFTDPSGNTINNVFVALSAPSAQIEVKAPSVPRNFNAVGQTNQTNLSWSKPSTGNYQIYNYPDPGSSNAVTFTITRDGDLIAENLDAISFVDTGLDHNTNYDYDIISVSVVNTSSVVEDNALTKPGTPVLSLSGEDNQITLTWDDPEVTGNDGIIDYQIDRQWFVGEQTYTESITSLDLDVNDQTYTDAGLLNSTAYSYRVRSHNTSGYSNWTSYQEEVTNIGSDNMDIVSEILDSTYQVILPPSNAVQLNWVASDNVSSYRIYEKNILLGSSLDGEYIDPESDDRTLLNSTLYQYVVTRLNDSNEESLPSELIEVTTLPEYIPEAPLNLSLTSGQNNIGLSWESVPGYGDPIGGAAAVYNIYRFNIDGFDLDSISTNDIIGSVSGVNNTSYTNSNLDDNLYYCYGVSGVNSENAEGSISNITCEITQDQLAATTPSNLNATGGNQQVSLSWSASSGSPTIHYQVYRSGGGYSNEFIADITSTSYTDTGLAKNMTYTYYVVAWNELGPSSASATAVATTSGQSNILAGKIPEDLTVTLDNNARASNYIDGYTELNWDAKEYSELPFNLSYSGNPYSPHTIVINSLIFEDSDVQISDGDVIAVFDNQLCVGLGTWPLPGGQMSGSKDDGSGNGFTDGAQAYFEVWDQSTGHVHTAIESPLFTFSGLGLDYVDLNVDDDEYTIYRNGEVVAFGVTDESYQDNTLEGEMDYEYAVAAANSLGTWTLSNVSQTALVNTDAYTQSAPVLTSIANQSINEDNSFIIPLQALDADDDIITFFAQPVDPLDPVNCVISNNELTLTPAQDHYGEFDIRVVAYDDQNFYEINTLSDEQIFTLTVNSVNDSPLLLNRLGDLQIVEGEYQDSIIYNLSDFFVDVDYDIMNDDFLTYSLLYDNNESVSSELNGDSLLLTILSSGVTNIFITATDNFNESVSDTLSVVIDDVLSADNHIWPTLFNLSNAYPNPFNPVTNFVIDIPYYANIDIKVYDISGREIDRVFSGYLSRGKYSMSWLADNQPSGVYFINMISDISSITKKVSLIK
tara:strand:+ start:2220 stop:7034 length:4815 start_codon:yes stop_codon:yes gene_type:complete